MREEIFMGAVQIRASSMAERLNAWLSDRSPIWNDSLETRNDLSLFRLLEKHYFIT